MTLIDYWFNGMNPGCPAIVQMMPTRGYQRTGYDFAEYQAARNAIEMAFTQENWDGYGALAISDETKTNALSALDYLETATRAPEITPNSNGTLSLGWETSHGYGQLEIGRTRYSFYVQPHHGSPFLDNGEVGHVQPTVGWLLEALLYPSPTTPVTAPTR